MAARTNRRQHRRLRCLHARRRGAPARPTTRLHSPRKSAIRRTTSRRAVGKIELYSTHLQNDPIPMALERSRRSPSGYPMPRPPRSSPAPPQLQVAGATHSIHANQKKLGKVDPDDIWIHPQDAEERIQDGQPVKAERYGATLPARVTDNVVSASPRRKASGTPRTRKASTAKAAPTRYRRPHREWGHHLQHEFCSPPCQPMPAGDYLVNLRQR